MKRARDAEGAFRVEDEAFARAVVERAERRLLAADLPRDDESVERMIGVTHTNDLYLVLAADGGDETAWARIVSQATPLLTGTLVRHGTAPAESEAIVADVLGDLAGPPPSGCTRTLLGTYGGTAAIGGWLCVIALRRASARFRGRRAPVAFGEVADDGRVGSPAGRSPDEDPSAPPIAREQAERFTSALDATYARLDPMERLALAAKHADGRSQVEIARALCVSEATVSRLVARGVATLRAGLAPYVGEQDEPYVARALALRLARSAIETPLSDGARPRPDVGTTSFQLPIPPESA